MMRKTILDNLERIEQEHNVRILYAVESGSRQSFDFLERLLQVCAVDRGASAG